MVTGDYESPRGGSDGAGTLFRDSKLGNLANGGVTVVALYLAEWLGELDVTPLPDVLEPLALGAIATAVGFLVSKVAKRR